MPFCARGPMPASTRYGSSCMQRTDPARPRRGSPEAVARSPVRIGIAGDAGSEKKGRCRRGGDLCMRGSGTWRPSMPSTAYASPTRPGLDPSARPAQIVDLAALDAPGSRSGLEPSMTIRLTVPNRPRPHTHDRHLGLLGQPVHEVDDLVALVVGNPAVGQGSPAAFFVRSNSSVTSSLRARRVLSRNHRLRQTSARGLSAADVHAARGRGVTAGADRVRGRRGGRERMIWIARRAPDPGFDDRACGGEDVAAATTKL